jgi:hypothetical protein
MCGHILLANYNIECVCCSMVPAAQAGFGSCSVSLARGWQKCKAANAQLFGCISGFLHMTSARICVSGGNIDGTCTSPRMYRRDWPAHRLSWRFRVCSTHTEVETSLNANPQKLQHLKMDKFESSSPTLRRPHPGPANMFHSVLLAALTGLATANVYDLAFPTYKTSCANGCATWTDIGSNNKYTQVCVCE